MGPYLKNKQKQVNNESHPCCKELAERSRWDLRLPWPGPGGTFSASLTFSYAGWTVIHLPPGPWVALSSPDSLISTSRPHQGLFHTQFLERSLHSNALCSGHQSHHPPLPTPWAPLSPHLFGKKPKPAGLACCQPHVHAAKFRTPVAL